MPEPLSQARSLFEKFTAPDAVAFLASLPTKPDKTFESDWLDFKRGRSQEQDIPRIWSKILGAFANNEGGVVVWGVVAEKDPVTNIDAVQSLDAVPDIYALKTRLMELRHQATDPPVANIEIIALPTKAGSREGFVVCLVPESRSKPHRPEHVERKFYLRMGDTSKECSVSLLRQLFYPKVSRRIQVSLTRTTPPPRLPRVQVPPFSGVGDDAKCTTLLSVANIGKWSVEEVFLTIKCGSAQIHEFAFSRATDKIELDRLSDFYRVAKVLHPGMRTTVQLLLATKETTWDAPWQFSVFARDMEPQKASIQLDRATPPDTVTFLAEFESS